MKNNYIQMLNWFDFHFNILNFWTKLKLLSEERNIQAPRKCLIVIGLFMGFVDNKKNTDSHKSHP